MFTPNVNAACINEVFNAGTLFRMALHASTKRLLDFAREKTSSMRPADQVRDFAHVGARLGVTPAVMTNWKTRGVSKEGAFDAQLHFGCNAWWLLTGQGPQSIASWPFTHVTEARWHACDETDKGYVQGVMNQAFDLCEQKRDANRKPRRPFIPPEKQLDEAA